MPRYEYECSNGHITEIYDTVEKRKKFIKCGKCHKPAERIFSIAGIRDSKPKWLNDDVRMALQDFDNPDTIPITTRQELERHCKDKGVVCVG